VTNLEALVAARTEQLRSDIHDLERSYDITIEALGDALRMKDAETESHCNRVCAFTTAIARAMGVPRDQLDVIARGAFLHDIGMLSVPRHILRKPGTLTADETASIREHCNSGYRMLQKIPFLQDVAEIVYAHHERSDGTRYPRRLKGEQIPLGARICAVAETFDAITSNRPCRAAQSFEAARMEIQAWSGKQFDPKIVQAFLGVPEHVWIALRREIKAREV
jgi:putative nucleotidyltransferase with HDIG domain